MKKKLIPNSKNTKIQSPLRYPGGKGFFVPYFAELMRENGLEGTKYFEPFAGGAGVALGLISEGVASEVVLNDADFHIYCFWKAILEHNDRFIDYTDSVPLSLKHWNLQKEIYGNPKKYTLFEVAFSTFYLNRCNRSGIIAGAGPIGGRKQNGKWLLDARFNKATLIQRIADIGKIAHRITIKNMDAINFFKSNLPRGTGRKNVFVYSDPPYVRAGNKLYLNFYSKTEHQQLAQYLQEQKNLNWIVSYDDCPFIRQLYAACQKWLFSLGYSLQSKQRGCELLIAPQYLSLPTRNKITTNRWNLIREIPNPNKKMEVLV